YQSEVFVKRLRKRPLSLISDNKDYPPIVMNEDEEIKIIGRVVGTYDLNYRRL
ncbi:S24 family peptidase, partial [Campylobacter coli]|nr:S24 family peptidase [Campylobacter coli]